MDGILRSAFESSDGVLGLQSTTKLCSLSEGPLGCDISAGGGIVYGTMLFVLEINSGFPFAPSLCEGDTIPVMLLQLALLIMEQLIVFTLISPATSAHKEPFSRPTVPDKSASDNFVVS
jgi:hypothetical protein